MTILKDLTTQKLNTSGQQDFLSINLFCGWARKQDAMIELQSDLNKLRMQLFEI